MSSQEIEEAVTEIRSHIGDLLTTLDSQMDEFRLAEIVEHVESEVERTLRSFVESR